ncbi:MAG TPA: hypothetical protein VK138_10005 [Acidiferrobacterales bacterium]|nr:hypothetical protein [Acidiferrobacterales bacterium]
MKIKTYIYTIALAAIMGGYGSLLPYNSALAQTSDKGPAQKPEKSTGSSVDGGAQSSMHEREPKGTPAKGGKAMVV